jgi:hypothetical protein
MILLNTIFSNKFKSKYELRINEFDLVGGFFDVEVVEEVVVSSSNEPSMSFMLERMHSSKAVNMALRLFENQEMLSGGI